VPDKHLASAIEQADIKRESHAEGVDGATPPEQQGRRALALVEECKAEQPRDTRVGNQGLDAEQSDRLQ
jgi:hypothetical protein